MQKQYSGMLLSKNKAKANTCRAIILQFGKSIPSCLMVCFILSIALHRKPRLTNLANKFRHMLTCIEMLRSQDGSIFIPQQYIKIDVQRGTQKFRNVPTNADLFIYLSWTKYLSGLRVRVIYSCNRRDVAQYFTAQSHNAKLRLSP